MKRTVTAIIPGDERIPGACEIYRITMPLHYLARKGWNTRWLHASTIRQYGPLFLNRLVTETDIFVIPRGIATSETELAALQEFIDALRDRGAKVVYEVDDDYTNEHREVHDGDAIGVASLCDAITVTTPYLGEMMTEKTVRPHYVLPNMLDPDLWKNYQEPKRLDRKQILIGLTGSPTHEHDWRVLEMVLPEILERFQNVSLLVGGYHPDYLQELPRTQFIPPVNYDAYSQIIRSCDIILAPIDPEDKFNWGKSPIKAIEGMGATRTLKGSPAGAAIIATDAYIYRLAVQDGITGLLVEQKPEAWLEALYDLISNTELRHRLQRAGWKKTWKHYNIADGASEWSKAYHSILKQ